MRADASCTCFGNSFCEVCVTAEQYDLSIVRICTSAGSTAGSKGELAWRQIWDMIQTYESFPLLGDGHPIDMVCSIIISIIISIIKSQYQMVKGSPQARQVGVRSPECWMRGRSRVPNLAGWSWLMPIWCPQVIVLFNSEHRW